MTSTLTREIRRLLAVGGNDLSDALAELTPAEWLAVRAEAGQQRCTECGESDGCVCDRDDGDVA